MKVIYIKKRTLNLTLCLLLICVFSMGLSVVPKAIDYRTEEVVTAVDAVKLPIIMYHSILKDPARANDYTISPGTLESDIKYLVQHGYTFILGQDLIDYVYGNKNLPNKPILITFDDGHYNNYYYAMEILERYNAKAIISPIGIECVLYTENTDENPNYAYCSIDNLKIMVESGIFEVANHSYNLHDYGIREGSKILDYEDVSSYKNLFVEDTLKAESYLEAALGCEITAYTYPFGAYCRQSEDFLKKLGYKITFITEDKTNIITRSADSLYMLARYNRPSGISTAEFMQKMSLE